MGNTAFVIHSAAIAGTFLPGVLGHAVEAGREVHRPETASNLFHRLASVGRYNGMATFQTSGIKALLDLMPQGAGAAQLPYPCLDLSVGSGLELWQLKQDNVLPKLATGTVHEKLVIAKGQLAITDFSWGGMGQPLIADLKCYPLSADGIASYFTKSAVAAPALPPLEGDYEIASVTWAGTAIEVESFGLNIQAAVQPRWGNGKPYPQFLSSSPAGGVVSIGARLQVADSALFRSWGENFQAGAVGNLVIVAKNFALAAERGANTVTLTLRGVAEFQSLSGGRPGSGELQVTSLKDDTGTVVPLTWATA
jgi:hypothetical protein